MNGLESALKAAFPKPRRGPAPLVNLCRFADDFIITGRSQALLEQEVMPFVQRFLAECGLELSPEKTRITHIDTGFDFLGQTVRKYHGKLLITPAKGSVKALLDRVRSLIKTHKATPAGALIAILNPLIQGWAQYHRHVVSARVFAGVDRAIFHCLWRWALRRHPGRSKQWIRQKYFGRVQGDHWVFQGSTAHDAHIHGHYLRKASKVSIQRHVKIRGAANPYDPQWASYFADRSKKAMRTTLQERRKLLKLWEQQQGLCPVCGQPVTLETGWHRHHVTWKAHGGTDEAENLLLLHPNCHRQVHWSATSV